MGTEYTLYKEETEAELDLSIHEMSNQFSIAIDSPFMTQPTSISDLEPKDCIEIFVKGLQVCSYWMDDSDFQEELTKQLKEKGITP